MLNAMPAPEVASHLQVWMADRKSEMVAINDRLFEM